MPFIALQKSTGNRIDITKVKNPRSSLDARDCICQLCGEQLMIRAGMIVTPHFAHFAHAECKTEYRYHPESREHREAKIKLAELLKTSYEEYSTAKLEYEVPIPEIRRVADILVEFPSGWRIAHEIQLAKINDRELQERTDDYFSAGIDVIWWLGKSADTSANRRWCIDNFGHCFCLNLSEEIGLNLRIYYTDDNYRRGTVIDYDEYGEPYRRDTTDKENYLWARSDIKNLLQDHFKRSALIRYIQIWGNGKISKKRFVRAFSGTHKLYESLSGIIGAYNNSKKVIKISEDEWEVPGIDEIYKNVRRLDETGVEAAKQRAWANKQQRQSNI